MRTQLVGELVRAMAALVDACAQTNSWILIDGCVNVNSACLLLDMALQATSSTPVILHILSTTVDWSNAILSALLAGWSKDAAELVSGLGGKNEEPMDNEQLGQVHGMIQDTMDKLKRNAAPVDPMAIDGIDGMEVVQLSESPWDWPARKGRSVAMSFPYCPFRLASHFIVAAKFPLSWFGATVGGIVLNGDGTELQQCRDYIMSGSPTVILQYTGNAADMISHIYDATVVHGKSTPDEVIAKVTEAYPPWLDEAGNLYGLGGMKESMYPIVTGFLDTYAVAPLQMENMIVVTNVWKQSPETVLQELSSCFAAASHSKSELGARTADADSVQYARELQHRLERSAQRFAYAANTMSISGTVLSFLSTVAALLRVWMSIKADKLQWVQEFRHGSSWSWLIMTTIVLPATAGIFITLLSRLRYVEKWGRLHVAAAKVESEIFVVAPGH